MRAPCTLISPLALSDLPAPPSLPPPPQSILLQPVFTNDKKGKVLAVILAMNKREIGSEADILFEDDFTAVRINGQGRLQS